MPCSAIGLIIDAFGELRDQQEQVREDMEVCKNPPKQLYVPWENRRYTPYKDSCTQSLKKIHSHRHFILSQPINLCTQIVDVYRFIRRAALQAETKTPKVRPGEKLKSKKIKHRTHLNAHKCQKR